MYADDLVVFSPSTAGLQQLLNICSVYGVEHDIKYNAAKSTVMICRTKEDKCMNYPDFCLSNVMLNVTTKTKYLGHIITADMSDDDDIYRQCRMLYAQANTLKRKFGACTDNVKMTLFKSYCTPLYTAHLWTNYKKASLQRLQVAYNDAFRVLLRRPRWTSATELFVSARVKTLQAVLRTLMYNFICRLNKSENEVLLSLTSVRWSATRYQSEMWKHWYSCLFKM